MAGHSKWANIKHRKGVKDIKKSKLFSKIIRSITAAAKKADVSIEQNAKLKAAIMNARCANITKFTIESAIKNAKKNDGAEYSTIVYEGYGPYGVAIVIECITENINRTVSFLRSIFNKYDGSLGKNGSLRFLLKHVSLFKIDVSNIKNKESFILQVIDAGIESLFEQNDTLHCEAPINNFGAICDKLLEMNKTPAESSIKYVFNTHVKLQKSEKEKVEKLIEALNLHDDVQEVYHNMKP